VTGPRAGDQRLDRDATYIDAGAADQLSFDDGGLHTLSRHALGQRRSGLSGPDNYGVKFFRHGVAP